MVLCIYGFPTNIAALQFEWAWQHPEESLAVRKAAASFKSLTGLANKIKLAYTMLTLPPWQSLNLTLNLFSTKYQQYTSSCPALPQQMQARVCSMDGLPCYNDNECDEGSSQEFKNRKSREEVHNDIPEENFNHQINDVNFESSGTLGQILLKTQSPGLVDSSDKPLNKRTTAVEYQPLIKSPGEVEIIDTFTPSPCLGKAGSKNRKRRRQTKHVASGD